MPTFCRHNRFLERCPICSATLPGNAERARSARGERPGRAAPGGRGASSPGGTAQAGGTRRRPRSEHVRIHREDRSVDDGYRSALLPGVRASADASRLAEEIAFSHGRLLTLASAPAGLYAEARALAADDREQATWMCLLIAYLCPLDGADPFAGIRLALREDRSTLVDLEHIPLGPRAGHQPGRGSQALDAYRKWVAQAGSAELAFTGDLGWSAERRFERLFERLALPGLPRMCRFDLLVTLGRLGIYELRADSLHLVPARAQAPEDPATAAAKRVFAIGDPHNLERRSAALATAVAVPVEVLDAALANWGTGERATLGFPPDTCDHGALQQARAALGL